jgi:hypothetical protein
VVIKESFCSDKKEKGRSRQLKLFKSFIFIYLEAIVYLYSTAQAFSQTLACKRIYREAGSDCICKATFLEIQIHRSSDKHLTSIF